MKPLNGVRILDLTSRLPGPLASHILANLGAQVIKLEGDQNPDPFLEFPISSDQTFAKWHQTFSTNKQIRPLKQDEIQELIKNADIVIYSKKINWPKIDERTQLRIQILASLKEKIPLHDLNLLAQLGLLKIHTHNQNNFFINPPFIPVAGVAFAQQIAIETLAYWMRAKENKKIVDHQVAMKESLEFVYAFLKEGMNTNHQYLHNGSYPCYGIYKTSGDQYLAVACVEEKYWLEFCQLFNLPLKLNDRFSQDQQTFQIVSAGIKKFTIDQLKDLLKTNHICIDLI